jgi:hypothetical protein
MKKLFILCLLLATVFEVKAQSKEETISWLNEKLTKYLADESTFSVKYEDGQTEQASPAEIKLISIDECRIVIQKKLTYPRGEIKEHTKMILPTAVLAIHPENGHFKYAAEVVSYETEVEKNGVITPSSSFFSDTGYASIRNGEENIRERVATALKHLATFCPKKQETF